jgi:hypothetical protein
MNSRLSRQWLHAIRTEAARLEADEEHVHNNVMHRQILETWKAHSPQMWARLEAVTVTQPLAKVLQARMWNRQEELLRAGMPVTDARELAEKENLMLEPEAEAGDRLPLEPENP